MFSNLTVAKEPESELGAMRESVAVLETLVSALIQCLGAQRTGFSDEANAAIARTGADDKIKGWAREALQKSLSRIPE